MKMNLSKGVNKIFVCLMLVAPFNVFGQNELAQWSFSTGGNVNSTITISDGLVYVGSYDSIFYVIDTLGLEQWRFNSHYSIQSNALIYDSIVCFQSGNRLIALNKKTGVLLFEHKPADVLNKEPIIFINPFDLKDSSPVLKDSIAYYGNEYGNFYGVNMNTGQEAFKFETQHGYPITTTAAIVNDTAYFGDIEGFVYAVSLSNSELIWEMRTYDGNKPYDFFGPVNGTLVVENDFLFFGLYNDVFQVLNRFTGSLAWSATDGGSWITGIPLIENGVMYIGSSDSKKLHAFNAKTGENIWETTVSCGIYNKAAFYKDYIVVLAGYYNWESFQAATNSTGSGSGRLMIIDKQGNVVNAITLSGSVFSTPIVLNNKLYFGSMDDNIYCINLDTIIGNANPQIIFDGSDLILDTIEIDGNKKIELPKISNLGTALDKLKFSIISSNLPEGSYSLIDDVVLNAKDSVTPWITLKSRLLENQDYTMTFHIKSELNPNLAIEKNIAFSKNVVSVFDASKNQGNLNVYPNPFKNILTIELPDSFCEGNITFFDVNGKVLKTQNLYGNKTKSINLSNITHKKQLIFYKLSDQNNLSYFGSLVQE